MVLGTGEGESESGWFSLFFHLRVIDLKGGVALDGYFAGEGVGWDGVHGLCERDIEFWVEKRVSLCQILSADVWL